MSQMVENAWMGTALILVTVLLRQMLRHRLPAETWLALWGLCLVRLFSPSSPESVLSIYNLFSLVTQSEPASAVAAIPATGISVTAESSVAAEPAAFSGTSWMPQNIFIVLYLLGAACVLVWLVVGWFRTRRAVFTTEPISRKDTRYSGMPRYVRIQEGAIDGAPLTFGVFRPIIVLPPELSGDVLTFALLHESIHAKRRDNLWNYAMAVALVVYWWNPAVWLMSRLLRMDMEKSCDRAVLSRLGRDQRSAYASALITLSTVGKSRAFSHAFGQKQAEERIVAIMKFKKLKITAVALALLLVCSVGTAFTAGAVDAADVEGTVTAQVEQDISIDGDTGIPLAEVEYAAESTDVVVSISGGETADVEGLPDLSDPGISTTNVNKSETITLGKGKSKTYTFNVDGGLLSADHNTVSVVITKLSGDSYQYISEDTSTGKALANVPYSSSANRTMTNLDPDDTYEITLINLGTSDLQLEVSITSYIS